MRNRLNHWIFCCLLFALPTSIWSQAISATDTLQIRKWIERGTEAVEQNADSANFFLLQAWAISDENDYHTLAGDAAHQLGLTYFHAAQFDSSNYYFEKAVLAFGKAGDHGKRLSSKSELYTNFFNQGAYDQALEGLLQVYKELEERKVHYPSLKGSLLGNIGQIYQNLQDYALSNEYLNNAKQVFEEADEPIGVATCEINIAVNLMELQNLDSAIYLANSALETFTEYEFIYGVSGCYHLLGTANKALGRNSQARHYLDKAIQTAQAIGDIQIELLSRLEFAEIEKSLGNLVQAQSILLEAKDRAHESQLLPELARSTEALAMVYEESGNTKKALATFKEFKFLADSLLSVSKSEQITQLEKAFQTQRKEQQILLQKEQLARNTADIERKNTIGYALGTAILLLVIIGGLVYRNGQTKAKSLSEKEALLKEIHHRVKNNLQVVSSLLNMQARQSEDGKMKEAIKEGQSRVKAMSLIHQKLYQTDNLSEIDMQTYISELNDQLAKIYRQTDRVVTSEIKADVKLDIDTAVPMGLILNELLSNAYKYAFQNRDSGKISVAMMRLEGQELMLEVSDDGVGMTDPLKDRDTPSLGLRLVDILTKQLRGTMSYVKEGGSKFSITFNDAKLASLTP